VFFTSLGNFQEDIDDACTAHVWEKKAEEAGGNMDLSSCEYAFKILSICRRN
jgi:hypothetical protein